MVPSVAVVGATGAVGEIMRQVLTEHAFPLRAIKFLASERSAAANSMIVLEPARRPAIIK